MSKVNLELVIEEFVLEGFKSMSFYLKSFNQKVNVVTLPKYSSIMIASVIDLIENEFITDTDDMRVYLRTVFIKRLNDFKKQNVSENLKCIGRIDDKNHLITFYIWCIDSFYYFLKDSINTYKIYTSYSDMIESVLNNKSNNDTIFDLSRMLYEEILTR